MLETVQDRLLTFGYIAEAGDDSLITLLINKVSAEIKLDCNVSEVPEKAEPLVADIITGEFLQHKKAIGADLGSINLEAVAKSIRLGDTAVEFGSSDPATCFDKLISQMISSNRSLITASVRRLDWS